MNKLNLCAVIAADTVQTAIQKAQEACQQVPLVEVRVDYLQDQRDVDISPFKRMRRKIVLTCRRNDEMGKWHGTEKARLGILTQAFNLDLAFVDVELKTLEEGFIVPLDSSSKRIVSFHDFKKTPHLADMKKTVNRMKRFNPHIMKIATMIRKDDDRKKALSLLLQKKAEEKMCVIGMGDRGRITRIVGPHFGSEIAYCTINSGEVSAPGQISCEEIKNIYRLLS